jgi:hypothetical protein
VLGWFGVRVEEDVERTTPFQCFGGDLKRDAEGKSRRLVGC